MKKLLITVFAVFYVLTIALPVFADYGAAAPLPEKEGVAPKTEEAKAPQEPEMPGNPINKFGRGMCNLVTFPMEIIEQSKRVKAEYGSTAGMTYGIARGLLMAGVRAIVGVYEVATFCIPYPIEYKPILTDPVSFFPQPPKKPE